MKLLKILNLKRKLQLMALSILMIVGALFEMGTLGAIVPLITNIIDPSSNEMLINLEKTYNIKKNFLNDNIIFVFITVALISGVIRIIIVWLSLKVSYGVGLDIGVELFKNILQKEYSWHLKKNSSELLTNFESVNSIVSGVLTPLIQGVVAIITTLAILIMLISINVKITFITIGVIVIIYALMAISTKRKLEKNSEKINDTTIEKYKIIQESLGLIREIKIRNKYSQKIKNYILIDSKLRMSQSINMLIGIVPRYVIETAGIIMVAIMMYFLSRNNNAAKEIIPLVGVLALAGQRILPQLQIIYFSITTINSNKEQLKKVMEIINTEENNQKKINQSDETLKLNEKENYLRLKNLSFNYEEKIILNKINLEIKLGSIVGIKGETGSGKSTLVDIIMGFLRPNDGEMCLNEIKISRSNIDQWQSKIAFVPQDIFLLDGSIAFNIALEENINYDDLRKAIEKSKISEFIEQLPLGIETKIGERGAQLSGGQKQRIALARAFYRNSELIILDEATSSLDIETETAVMEAILNKEESITLIIIAHRLHTLEKCDSIIELVNKKINIIK